MNSVIRAIDTGYGSIKYSMCGSANPGGIQCRSFPSLVAEPSQMTAGAAAISGQRRTITLKMDDKVFEMGPDVEKVMGMRDGRSLHKDYSSTDEYLALTRGAMSYMGVTEIDVLVVGLPVNASQHRYKALRDRLTGPHEVADSRVVTVKDVKVIAQPIGGFLDYAMKNNLGASINETQNLMIDVGFFTLDFVTAQGTEPMAGRSGAVDTGVSECLKRINSALVKDFECDDININRLDRAVRDGEIRLFGDNVDLAKYMKAAESVINEGLNALQAKVGSGSDIDNIFLCGGGASLYADAVRERFPRHRVGVVDDPIFANARGFQIYGELYERRMRHASGGKAA